MTAQQPEDFEYKGFYCRYDKHPKLYGHWEIYHGETFVGRAASKKEVYDKLSYFNENSVIEYNSI